MESFWKRFSANIGRQVGFFQTKIVKKISNSDYFKTFDSRERKRKTIDYKIQQNRVFLHGFLLNIAFDNVLLLDGRE